MKTFENRELVVPGDILYIGRVRAGENTYRYGDKVLATRVGLVEYGRGTVSVIALEAGYQPLIGDLVVGDVVDMELGCWYVDIGAPTRAVLNVPDAIGSPYRPDMVMPEILDVGDTIAAKVIDLDRRRTPILSILGKGLGRIEDGMLIEMTPSKIPRLIGKKGSMVTMVLKETGCDMIIGQNGRLVVKGSRREQEEMVVKVIRMIEMEAHTTGLTNRIQEYLRRWKEGKA